MDKRVVVTGFGAISPLGLTAEDSWKNAVNGVSAVGKITQFDASEYLVQIACEVKGFDPAAYMPAKEARRMDRYEQFAVVAAQEAINHAGLNPSEMEQERVGVVVSSAIGGLHTLRETVETLHAKGPRRISPFAIPMLMANGAAGMIGIRFGFKGPAFSVASACASGADGLGLAWTMLKLGMIDVAITGASESTVDPVGVATFDRLGAMSRRNDDYSMTPQPFDLNRDGLVMGEGAAILVLECEEHAKKRGANIIAELAGYGSTADAFHVTAPSQDGAGGRQAIKLALESAGVNRDEVDYINAHGTATQLNDISETLAIKGVFGEDAYRIPVSSTKSMTGHIMGATGALEAIFCSRVVRDDVIPPTIHYQTPDPKCDLDYVPNQARELPVNVAVSNSFGFGGHNAVLVFRKYH